MNDQNVRPRRGARLALLGVVVAAGIAIWFTSDQFGREHYWQGQLDSVNDDDAAVLLRRWVEQGPAGMRVVVHAMDSPRPAVALAARHAIRAQLDRWSLEQPRTVGPKMVILAEILSQEVEHFGPEARHFAADFAQRILLWPLDDTQIDRTRLVAACDRVLRAKGSIDLADDDDIAAGGKARPSIDAMLEQPHLAATQSPPTGTLLVPPLPPELFAANEPAKLADVGHAEPLLSDPAEPVVSAVGDGLAEQMSTGGAGRMVTAGGSSEDLSKIEGFDLFTRMNDADPAALAMIQAELSRRGYKPRQIEIARHLTSPDAVERRQWVEALPGLTGMDAKPWLMRLSRDPDARVRLSTVTLMATSTDPAMLRRVAEVSRSDPDERVQLQATRLVSPDADGDGGSSNSSSGGFAPSIR